LTCKGATYICAPEWIRKKKEKNETHEIERENLDIGQKAAVERRGYGRVHRAGVHREVADLRGARARRE
jgi:hypothetical protein